MIGTVVAAIEFARPEWLWSLIVVPLFFVAWWFARRFRKQRVTYGDIWRKVTGSEQPRNWRKRLRTILTWIASTCFLVGLGLFAGGITQPETRQPSALVVVIDNSVSMLAQDENRRTRLALAQDRIAQESAKLTDEDVVAFVWFADGRALASRWLSPDSEPPDISITTTPPDWASAQTLLEKLTPPRREPSFERKTWVLTDDVAACPLRSAVVESVGVPVTNNYLSELRVDNDGALVAKSSLGSPIVSIDGKRLDPASIRPRELTGRLRVSIPLEDAIDRDNNAILECRHSALSRVLVLHQNDSEPNLLLLETLRSMLPDATVVASSKPAPCDLLVQDAVSASNAEARYRLRFAVGGPQNTANAGLIQREDIRAPFMVPDFSLLEGSAVTLNANDDTVLLRHLKRGPLIVLRQNTLDIGFDVAESSVLQDASGLLLLMRWLDHIRQQMVETLPLVLNVGESRTVQLHGMPPYRATLSRPMFEGAATILQFGQRGDWTQFGPLPYAGLWEIRDANGNVIGRTWAHWSDATEQSASVSTGETFTAKSTDEDNPTPIGTWLLVVALITLLAEWIGWAIGVTE